MWLAAWLGCLGCAASPAIEAGLDQPIIVEGATFLKGDLPVGTSGPQVGSIGLNNSDFIPGQAGKAISGTVDSTAYSVAIRVQEAGTGYWLVPVGTADPFQAGQLDWSCTASFARSLAPGKYTLAMVAFDGGGNAGALTTQDVIAHPLIPAGRTVISLRWNSAADLDLVVTTPAGLIVSPKNVTTTLPSAATHTGPSVGTLDRDSETACVEDGLRQEDLVWPDAPDPGVYSVRVDMFSACSAAAATFDVRLIVDGNVVSQRYDFLSAQDADQGVVLGTDPPNTKSQAPNSAPGLLVEQLTF
ncbi:MAG: hypothetical protein ACHREM_06285 [Polyangiales bacterium]